MSINERIIKAVTPIVPECVPDLYEGEAEIYCTFNGNAVPVGFGDNRPRARRWLLQVHFYCPKGYKSLALRLSLCRAIHGAGFTYPTEENASDGDGQHYVLEFEGLGEA